MAIKVKIGDTPNIKVRIGDISPINACLSDITVEAGSQPSYDGVYDITPRMDSQVMATANKRMIDDVTIRGIPIYEVSNESGGNTIYIATSIDE